MQEKLFSMLKHTFSFCPAQSLAHTSSRIVASPALCYNPSSKLLYRLKVSNEGGLMGVPHSRAVFESGEDGGTIDMVPSLGCGKMEAVVNEARLALSGSGDILDVAQRG